MGRDYSTYILNREKGKRSLAKIFSLGKNKKKIRLRKGLNYRGEGRNRRDESPTTGGKNSSSTPRQLQNQERAETFWFKTRKGRNRGNEPKGASRGGETKVDKHIGWRARDNTGGKRGEKLSDSSENIKEREDSPNKGWNTTQTASEKKRNQSYTGGEKEDKSDSDRDIREGEKIFYTTELFKREGEGAVFQ